ncbi:hypothetical protein Nepgr_014814 [Nepenthes gracilis]|uniref:Uncharacterized protein n=1 Tax=Nepenthes gracilis TaxID=150966 RepID=A0AAD3XQ70_NEPGR|nr:hypothetical protein Nepgr_014814 [Nepenthes gracilis]
MMTWSEVSVIIGIFEAGVHKLDDTNALRGSEEPGSVNNIDGIATMALSSSQCELNPQSSIEDCCARKSSGAVGVLETGRWPVVFLWAISGIFLLAYNRLAAVAEPLVVILYDSTGCVVRCSSLGWLALNCPVMLLLLLKPALGGLMMLLIAGVGWLDD